MFIKNIVIDGFKSYAKRTEISGFDNSFNAITGLNGSGKSNILDAICFLLGITNLSHVRASNLQELVYKSGQAGVTKASVSIIFDNRDKAGSPIGYQDFDELTITRQIVIGGKNKYLINGITVNNQRVSDLFRSVQLNVNNPHFLIMQGRITKVLNMKPPEILSLLEEACSTKAYEDKRKQIVKNMDEKEIKLQEIKRDLDNEIEPKLVRLRSELKNYKEYQAVSNDLDFFKKFVVGDNFLGLKKIIENFEGEVKKSKDCLENEQLFIKESEEKQKQIEDQIEKLNEEKTTNHDLVYEEMDKQMTEMKKTYVLLNNGLKRAKDKLSQGEQQLSSLQQRLKSEEKSCGKIEKEISLYQNQYDTLHQAVVDAESELNAARKNLKDVNMGLFNASSIKQEDGTEMTKAVSLSDILRMTKRQENDLSQAVSNLNRQLIYYKDQMKEFNEQLSKTSNRDTQTQQIQQQHSKLEKNSTKLTQQISQLNFDNNSYKQTNQQYFDLRQELRQLNQQKDSILIKNNRFEFEYKRPYINFNDDHIYGIVARLARLKSEEFSVAMEIIASSKLFNVVVETDEIAAELLNRNCLSTRTTLLPLNKMRGYVVPDHKYRTAQQIYGADKVWHPMHLLEFNERFRPAMNHVFGTCLIAKDLDTAKAVAFDKRINVRCVTLEGDMFDPEGTLMGGSAPQTRKIFHWAIKYNEIIDEINQKDELLELKSQELEQLKVQQQEYQKLEEELRRINQEKRQLEVAMLSNNFLQVELQLKEAETNYSQIKKEIEEKSLQLDLVKKKLIEAESNFENATSVQEKAKKDAQIRFEKAEENLEKKKSDFSEIQNRYESLDNDLVVSKDLIQDMKTNIENKRKDITEIQLEIDAEQAKIDEHDRNSEELKHDYQKQKEIIDKILQQISQLRLQSQQHKDNREEANIRIDNINYDIETIYANRDEAGKKLKDMLKKYAWLSTELETVMNRAEECNLGSRKEIDAKIIELERQKEKLVHKVDLRGMNMLAPTEKKCNELHVQYKKILKDKENLKDIIKQIDLKKIAEVERAHKQVDEDFNKIFSTLLPGSQARLVAPEGLTVQEGLEFRIAFGNVWKESLNELSGGQRSLVALSLILALLRFKPAPLYILDEIDAALDTSHTQNIGTIIREQFNNSQFVIVSLKEGMFSNANVLFKTKFVDGVSTVSRQVNTVQNRRPMATRN